MLLQQQDHFHAAQHYAVCTTEHDAWWPRKGLIHALLGLNKLESARRIWPATGNGCLPPATGAGAGLSAARAAMGRGLGRAHPPVAKSRPGNRVAPGGHSAGAAAQDEGKALEQANALSLRFFGDHKFRVSIDNFILNASLAVLWHYPSATRISALQQEYRYLSQAVTLRAHEEALLKALMLSLDYRFDEALLLLAKHRRSARDHHLNQLLGFAVSQFCGLPHHAQRYLSQLSQYQARVAPAPLVQQLFKQVIGDFMKQLGGANCG